MSEELNLTTIMDSVVNHELRTYPGNVCWGVIQTIIIIVITIFIILGNVTNIFVISRSTDTFNITGYFLISLAFADLGVGLLITPLAIGASIYHDWLEIYGWTLCETNGLVVAALCAISIYSITFLTLDKYVYIVYPLHYQNIFKPCTAKLAIAIMWAICFMYFVVHKVWWGTYYYDHKSYICTIDFPKQWDFTLFVIATIVLPPAIMIVVCNYKTFKVAQSHHTQIQDILRSVSTYNSETDTANPFATQPWQYKALKMNALIASAFFIAWIPYSIVQVIMSFTEIDIAQPVIFFIQWVALANSFWNSIIYYYLNKEYRSKALKLYRRVCCCLSAKENGDFDRNEAGADNQLAYKQCSSV